MEGHPKTAVLLEYMVEEKPKTYGDEYEIVGKQLTRLIQYWRKRE